MTSFITYQVVLECCSSCIIFFVADNNAYLVRLLWTLSKIKNIKWHLAHSTDLLITIALLHLRNFKKEFTCIEKKVRLILKKSLLSIKMCKEWASELEGELLLLLETYRWGRCDFVQCICESWLIAHVQGEQQSFLKEFFSSQLAEKLVLHLSVSIRCSNHFSLSLFPIICWELRYLNEASW